MKIRSTRPVASPLGLWLVIAAGALPACGKVVGESESHPTGGDTTTGSQSTSSTGIGGAGGETFTIPEGGTGTGGVEATCDPAPALAAPIGIAVPGGVTADFAAKGSRVALSMAPDGDAALMFDDGQHLFVRRLHAGEWADFEQIAAPSTGGLSSWGDATALVAGEGGRVTAVYDERHGTTIAVCARTFDVASGWSAPVRLALVTEGWWQDPVTPALGTAMDSKGGAIAVWPGTLEDTGGMFVRRFAPGSGWGDVEAVTPDAGTFGRPSVVLHDDGSALVGWHEQAPSIATAYAPPSSGWEPAVHFGSPSFGIQLAKGPAGAAVGLWGVGVNSSQDSAILVSDHAPGSGWVLEEKVGMAGDTTFHTLLLATSADGGRAAAWSDEAGDTCETAAHLAVLPPGGAWAPATVPTLGDAPSRITGLGAGDGGKVAVVWDRNAIAACDFETATLSWLASASGAWQTQEIDPDGAAAQVVVAPDGRALVAWERPHDPSILVRWMDLPAP